LNFYKARCYYELPDFEMAKSFLTEALNFELEAKNLPFQSDSLMPVSLKKTSLPSGTPAFNSAVRRISAMMCSLFIR
jgi:hypothetical protein